MKIINSLGLLAVPGTVPTGNLLWVDGVTGNDSLARRGCFTAPFKTLTAAKNAAASGDTIVVMPGTYNEKNLLKNGVNWHFLTGAKVIFPGDTGTPGNGAIFDTGSDGTAGAVACMITGYGDFSNSTVHSSGCVVNSNASGSNIYIEALSMISVTGACIRSTASTGSLRVHVKQRIEATSADAISITGSAFDTLVEAELIRSSGGRGVYVSDGGVTVKAHKITTSADPAIEIEAGTSIIHAYEIKADSDYGLKFNASLSGLVRVVGARIISGSGLAVYNASGTHDGIALINCVLVAADTTYSIDASGTGIRVLCVPALVANKTYNATHIAAPALTVIDSHIS